MPSAFQIYKDDTSTMSPSPQVEQSQLEFPTMNKVYDADNSVASTSGDDIVHSIETSNRESSNAYTNISSVPTSLYHGNNGTRKNSAAYTSVSSIPPSLPYNSDIKPYTPKKGPRAAFRSPSSVRALQMDSPPSFASPRSGGAARRYDRYESGMTSPSSARRYRPDTPSSLRSGSVMRQGYVESSQRSHRSDRGAPSTYDQQTPQRTGPIVLLHITLLPCSSPEYSAKSMKELAPAYVTENWRLLQEKLTDTVLDRGLLISHPGDEFDLLEERVLETLDLCPPRITACGHYYGGDSDSGNDSGVADVRRDSKQVRAICSSPHEEVDEEDVCHQCDQYMRLPGKGVGAGSRKWSVKIFAANGLMKASAWQAACSDMERVDVEIEPWMPDDVKRALDARLIEEEEEERIQADQVEHLKLELREVERSRYEAEAARLRAEDGAKATEVMRLEAEAARLRAEEVVKQSEIMRLEAEAAKYQAEKLASENEVLRAEAEAARLLAEESAKELDEELKRVISAPTQIPKPPKMVDTVQEAGDTLRPATYVPERSQREADVGGKDIALSTLLYNYMYLLTQDRRNLLLISLSILVLVLSYYPVVLQSAPSTTSNIFHPHHTYTPSAHVSMSSSTTKSPSQSTASVHSFSVEVEPSSSASIPSSSPSGDAVLLASSPGAQDAVPDQIPTGTIGSNSSSTSVYSSSASKAFHIARPESDSEAGKEAQTQTRLQTPLKASPVSAEQATFTAASSTTTPWTESKQSFVENICVV
ncbi:hypothetical protein E2P81_ATG11057 [Venturia nashicola]|nr:hypothetical protein E2P81_ATG11057 [Venturia nashicola]